MKDKNNRPTESPPKDLMTESPQTETAKESPPEKESALFWAKAEQYQLSGPGKEVKDQQGNIVQREEVITFRTNVYLTDNPEHIAHIRASNALASSHIVECKDEFEALKLSAQRRQLKQIKEFSSENIERTVYVRPGEAGSVIKADPGVKVVEMSDKE